MSGFPGLVLFLGPVRADFQKLAVCPVFAPIKAQSINMPEHCDHTYVTTSIRCVQFTE